MNRGRKKSKLPTYIILVSLILGVIVFGTKLFTAIRTEPVDETKNTVSQDLSDANNTQITPTSIPTAAPTEDNTDANSGPVDLPLSEYKKIKAEFEEIVNKENPKVALEKLRQMMEEDPKLMRSCHGLTHEIGHLGYKKYKVFADTMQYQDDVCGSGYAHGVVEQHFSNIPDVKTEMQVICKSGDGTCFHAVGHGLMYYTNNEIPASIDLCKTYSDKVSQTFCSEGVYMENFETNQFAHTSKYLRENEPFYPCPEETNASFKTVCYFYSGRYLVRLYKDDYKIALDYCRGSEVGFMGACAKGVGSIAMRQNIKNGEIVEDICKDAAANSISFCIDGAIGYHAVNYNSGELSTQICNKFQNSEYKNMCLESVSTRF